MLLRRAALLAVLTLATTATAADTPEPGSSEAIARFTTDPRYLNAWIASVPESATVPSPSDFLGHVAGAASELTRSARIHGYFRALARSSPRVRVETIGRTEEGRDILLAVIADEAGIRDLERLKAATAALADPRRTDPGQAEAVIAGARPFYYLNGALHADETGSAEMLMELAYRLAVSDDPRLRRIRENVVVLINPVAEPDGRDKMADWFYRYLKGRTDYAALPRQSPPYWGRYAFVDINRDAHQLAFEATRAVHRMFFDYHPQVIHDLHEGIPLLQTWNGTGPYNPNLDPIVLSAFLRMSLHEVTTLTALRFAAGLGLGGAMPNAAALASEYVPLRRRPFAVTLTVVCIPLGGTLAGFTGAVILPTYGWRALFFVGGALPLVLAALLWKVLPESPRYLARDRARWPELAALLRRLGHDVPPDATFVDSRERAVARASVVSLFAPDLRRDTLALSAAFFFCLLSAYVGVNWVPSILTSVGFDVATANYGLTAFNLGGVVGAILVKSGDHVNAGEIVIKLDDTQTRANLGVITGQANAPRQIQFGLKLLW